MQSIYFVNLSFSRIKLFGLHDKNIRSIYEDRNGVLWVGTHENGLYKINQNRSNVSIFLSKREMEKRNKVDHSKILSNRLVRCIYETKTGQLWVGTAIGLNRYIKEKDGFYSYYFDKTNCGYLII